MTSPPTPAARTNPTTRARSPGQTGAVQAPLALAGGLAALVLLVLLVAAGVLGTGDDSACTGQAAAQPGVAASAKNSIPATYLQLYRQAGQQYGLPWNVLAGIGKIESDHGRDPGSGVRSGANDAGAAGPMQIGVSGRAGNNWGGAPRHRAGQKTGGVGVDGDGDGWADVHDPFDAIPGAARYLLDHGAHRNMEAAVYAYNPSPDYVHAVLAQAADYATGDFTPVADTQAAMGGCPADPAAYAGLPAGTAGKIVTYARAQLGKPYVFGAEGPDSFDCSGLTMRAYQAAGITIPRTADMQYTDEPHIPRGHEQPGDLVFFVGADGSPTRPGHVGIVIGGGRMIVAPHTGTDVQIQNYQDRNDLVGFARPGSH